MASNPPRTPSPTAPSEGFLLQGVEFRFVAVDPGSRDDFVQGAPTDADGAVEAAVPVEGEEGFGVGFEAAAQAGVLAAVEVVAQNGFVAEGMGDAAGALDEEGRRDPECAALAVEGDGRLGRPELGQTAVARIEVEVPEERPHVHGGNVIVGGGFDAGFGNLRTEVRGEVAGLHVERTTASGRAGGNA
jgi:hypothetical protein